MTLEKKALVTFVQLETERGAEAMNGTIENK